MLTRTLILGSALAAAICVVGGGLGVLIAGLPGLLGAIVGGAIAAIYMALTAASILLGFRAGRGDMLNPVFFAVVLGGWLLKLIVFLVLILMLRGADWLNPYAFFFAVIAAVLGSLVIDVYVFATSRIPYVDTPLPRGETDPGSPEV